MARREVEGLGYGSLGKSKRLARWGSRRIGNTGVWGREEAG